LSIFICDNPDEEGFQLLTSATSIFGLAKNPFRIVRNFRYKYMFTLEILIFKPCFNINISMTTVCQSTQTLTYSDGLCLTQEIKVLKPSFSRRREKEKEKEREREREKERERNCCCSD
jgi:hypothetical protein